MSIVESLDKDRAADIVEEMDPDAAADRVAGQIEAWMRGNTGGEVVNIVEREGAVATGRSIQNAGEGATIVSLRSEAS